MRTTIPSKLKIQSILGLSLLLSTFVIGSGYIHALASSESGNATGIAGTTEIIIRDVNGTQLVQMSGDFPCTQTPEGGCVDVEPHPWDLVEHNIHNMNVSVTIKDLNGTEIITFENMKAN
ncbi:MAG TPA: hypothetical protein VFT71_05730 [Candidatus Nitrosocosmicus sp.]|nr:hypothetical protein [Candidatus Nitrosocosmicus sp.]